MFRDSQPASLAFHFQRQPGETAAQFQARVIDALDEADIYLPDDFGALMQANVGEEACALNVVAVAAHGPPEASTTRGCCCIDHQSLTRTGGVSGPRPRPQAAPDGR